MRHAKSSWDQTDLSDHDRPLAPRGRKAAKRMGSYMKDKGFEPSIVLCSSAVRARQTWELAAPSFSERTTLEVEQELYGAGDEELVARLRRLPPGASSVLLIGHNPAMQELVLMLCSEDAHLGAVRKKFPTAALAVLDAPIEDWEGLRRGSAELTDFVTPKGLDE
jgi:phosphohistidine phosphatase